MDKVQLRHHQFFFICFLYYFKQVFSELQRGRYSLSQIQATNYLYVGFLTGVCMISV